MLTRDDILSFADSNADIAVKEITIPEHIPAWGGKKLYIRQLTRGQQDTYLKRQFQATRLKMQGQRRQRSTESELSGAQIYGHDAWLFVSSVCDVSGKLLFTEADVSLLSERNGEAIGWVAKQVVEFSGMSEELSDLEKVTEEVKN